MSTARNSLSDLTFLWFRCLAGCLLGLVCCSGLSGQQTPIPAPLAPWKDWVVWDLQNLECPAIYNQYEKKICYWPGQLSLDLNGEGGTWRMVVTAFAETWFPLPGNSQSWPSGVVLEGKPIVVVERNERPAVKLPAGRHELSGLFRWNQMPQQLGVPASVGLVALQVDGEEIPGPSWDESGNLWLRRTQMDQVGEDQLSVQVYRLIQDGIPLSLRTRLEVTVSGRSREEDFGIVLPEGWKVTELNSPIPVAMDRRNQLRAQLRAGKWMIELEAVRNAPITSIGFPEGDQQVIDQELVALQPDPKLRLLELENVLAVDASQTTFPKDWAVFQTYLWNTAEPILLVEKLRGMGAQRSEELSVDRKLWFAGDGQRLMFRDVVQSRGYRWRLDTAAAQELGAVRIGGEGQVVSLNPGSGNEGVELRTRSVNLEAVGQVHSRNLIPASGWEADVDRLSATLELPPGWRALAVFGPDKVTGDWLTAWTMLDLFLWLIFGLAVTRVWGMPAGLVAFLGFGLSYHEHYSPRYLWFALLIPAAISYVMPAGRTKVAFQRIQLFALVLLLIGLIPYIVVQVQSGLYPQLEPNGFHYQQRQGFIMAAKTAALSRDDYYYRDYVLSESAQAESNSQRFQDKGSGTFAKFSSKNLLADPKQQVQTGPASPEWSWIQVLCDWDGPVSESQRIEPVLLPPWVNRSLVPLRVGLLLALLLILCDASLLNKFKIGRRESAGRRMGALWFGLSFGLWFVWGSAGPAMAQDFPDERMLQVLRSRLLQAPDAFPKAAEIPTVDLRIEDNRVVMQAEIHAAATAAIPLPGQLNQWSPVRVLVNGQAYELVCRQDGYLWIVLDRGVYQVTVESRLADSSSWELRYLLKPRFVTIDAPGWTTQGLVQGKPESQVLFTREQPQTEAGFAYDRNELNALVEVERAIEIGLVWQVNTTVRRFKGAEKSVALNIPLLPGERVLTTGASVGPQGVEVRLGPNEQQFNWVSELPISETLTLSASETDQWVERWQLMASPSWNLGYQGLPPIFENSEPALLPCWYPWPGEQVELKLSSPVAVPGATATVQNVVQEITLGNRQQKSVLTMNIDCSVGGDFRLSLNPQAEISDLTVSGRGIPVRRDGQDVVIPVSPGRQAVVLKWQSIADLQTRMQVERVGLPIEAANITTVVSVPRSRWILWASGPTLGPAVRIWTILLVALIAALVLGSLPQSPLKGWEWLLLVIGLTQIPISLALVVVGWLLVLKWMGNRHGESKSAWFYNLQQIGIILLTLIALFAMVTAVSEGLLGNPKMFIGGNDSTSTQLRWYEPFVFDQLSRPVIFSVSIWFYRLAMLLWALWLAASLLKWLKLGWESFVKNGFFKSRSIRPAPDPEPWQSGESPA
jgi:hypothetical protein